MQTDASLENQTLVYIVNLFKYKSEFLANFFGHFVGDIQMKGNSNGGIVNIYYFQANIIIRMLCSLKMH